MLIIPKKTKYLKIQKEKLVKNISLYRDKRFNYIDSVVLCVKENGYLIEKHLEIGRKQLKSLLDKKGQVYIIKFPHKPITKKPTGVRMGKGKGPVVNWVCPVYAGNVIFQVKNIDSRLAIKSLLILKKKIPIKMFIRLKRKPLILLLGFF